MPDLFFVDFDQDRPVLFYDGRGPVLTSTEVAIGEILYQLSKPAPTWPLYDSEGSYIEVES